MMLSSRIQGVDNMLRKLAGGLVIALCLLVPSFERQPVNGIAALLAVVVTARLLIAGRKKLSVLDTIDWTMAALLVSAILSTYFGWRSPSGGMQGIAEAIGLFTLFYCVRHGGYDREWLLQFAVAAIMGATIAALVSLKLHLIDNRPFALTGIPGTIRSALYLGIALTLSVGLALGTAGYKRLVWITVAFFLFAMLLFLHSRAVIIALSICLLVGLALRFRLRAVGLLMAMSIVILVTPTLMPKETRARFDVKATELVQLAAHGNISPNDQLRIDGWHIAIAWIRHGEQALLGIGPRNYRMIEALRDTLPLSRQVGEDAWSLSHAHNLFFTRYIEQGLLGLAVLLVLLTAIARRLTIDGLAGRTSWPWWGAWGGFLLPLLNGLVGSPWNREYVWLAVLSFAMYLALSDRAGDQSS